MTNNNTLWCVFDYSIEAPIGIWETYSAAVDFQFDNQDLGDDWTVLPYEETLEYSVV